MQDLLEASEHGRTPRSPQDCQSTISSASGPERVCDLGIDRGGVGLIGVPRFLVRALTVTRVRYCKPGINEIVDASAANVSAKNWAADSAMQTNPRCS